MKELFDHLEKHLVTHLWDIQRDADDNGGFKCSQQIEDARNCLSAIKKMHEILMMNSIV